jgi:hypothetical protein
MYETPIKLLLTHILAIEEIGILFYMYIPLAEIRLIL